MKSTSNTTSRNTESKYGEPDNPTGLGWLVVFGTALGILVYVFAVVMNLTRTYPL